MGTKQARQAGRARSWTNLVLAVVIGGGMSYALCTPLGPLPALAKAFNPGTGVWTSAANEQLLPHTQELLIKGMDKPVEIVFEANGTPHIKAQTNHDAFVAIGYLQAKNRLFEMDLMRRQGEGLLSEVVGASALDADKFQRQIGLDRTAEAEWQMVPPNSETHQVVEAFTAGINQVIDEEKASNELPMMFKFLGYQPTAWKPQDTLVLKGVLAQMMSLTGNPLYYQYYVNAFGYDKAMELLPIKPTNEQHPYDLGPYASHPLAELPISAEQAYINLGQSPVKIAASATPRGTTTTTKIDDATSDVASSTMAQMATASVLGFLKQIQDMPSYALHQDSNSNGWAVDGTKTASGKPLMAGDPHLDMTMPSVWYQLEVEAPDYNYSGVTVPGIPFALIGHNENISWTMTNGQEQQTFFYQEKMDTAHPNQYFWNGAWHDLATKTFQIPVKGGQTVSFDTKYSVHGPIITRQGMTMALDWMGQYPSHALESLQQVMKAHNFDDYKKAYSNWIAPTMNFVYADQTGNIGLISAGYYPQFAKGVKPWLPMPGTGEADFIGRIPYEDIPQSYNPPSHVLETSNQYQTKTDYPYYIGTTLDFDPGARANRISKQLNAGQKLTVDDMSALQNDVYDDVASKLVPELIKSLQTATLTETEKAAVAQLAGWDYNMDGKKVAPSVWYSFWENYLKATFNPWWDAYKIPYKDYPNLSVKDSRFALDVDLEAWTLHDPNNAWFTNPLTHEKRDAHVVMVQAFQQAVKDMTAKRGSDVSQWKWETVHTRVIPSIAQVPALGVSARGASGDSFTPNVAPGWQPSHGPSWRMIMDWGTGQSIGSYPGGQSENPVSPWYEDRVDTWWDGKYNPMLKFDEAKQTAQTVHWTLTPAP